MEFAFTEEEEKLREEMEEFFINELPEDYNRHVEPRNEDLVSFYMEFQKKIQREKGWLTIGWSQELGGLGLGWVAQGIADEVRGYWGVAFPNSMGYSISGPAVILFGTEEQKKWAIPPMTGGEAVSWWQAFTEPDAGSDEANVQTRAVEDGDDFIVNGQKTFITGYCKPDYLYTLVKTTDTIPKHRGLSLFLIPGDLLGITYHLQPGFCGHHGECEIFFDDVRVPKKYLLGELNRGFYHAMETLQFERTGTGRASRLKQWLEEFIEYCRETKRNGKPLIEEPQVRDTLAEIAIEHEVTRLTGWYSCWRFAQREKLGPAPPPLTRFFYKIFYASQTNALSDIMGFYSQLKCGSKWAPLRGTIECIWEDSRATHGGGTVEIYRLVQAQRALGLPRISGKFMAAIGQALKEAEAGRG